MLDVVVGFPLTDSYTTLESFKVILHRTPTFLDFDITSLRPWGIWDFLFALWEWTRRNALSLVDETSAGCAPNPPRPRQSKEGNRPRDQMA